MDDGTAIADSGAILDYLDEAMGYAALPRVLAPVLAPRAGPDRRRVLGLTALGHGIAEKYVSAWYETAMRPETHVWHPRLAPTSGTPGLTACAPRSCKALTRSKPA